MMACMKIANKSLLEPVEERREDSAQDARYMIVAIPITTRRFGPSGSLKNTNIARENIRAVTPRMSSEVFFDAVCMVVMVLEILRMKPLCL